MKCVTHDEALLNIWSLPVRGAWVEISMVIPAFSAAAASLPVRGAWVEMRDKDISSQTGASRSPCGERGLKSKEGLTLKAVRKSLPVRGAWVEIIIRAMST